MWIFIFLIGSLFAADKTICLNMIVKDESPVITRCLKSVKPFIDYWVIVDTGSHDGTQKIIRDFLKDIPGELHEQPWVNFGHNRNEALKLAKGKGDYLLFIDADEVLEGAFDKKKLHLDAYLGKLRTSEEGDCTFLRALLINNHLSWGWKGIIHESLQHADKRSFETVPNVVISAVAKDGNRSNDPQKYLRDAQTLEKAILDEPNNADYVYYLAQSYYNAQKYSLALKNYEKRGKMNGWEQHTFWSKYYTGHMQELLQMDSELIIKSYSDAFQYRPTRAEPLFRLAQHFYAQKNYILGYLLAKHGATIPVPDDIIYIEHWVYDYGMLAVYANCAMELGKIEEALTIYEQIANIKNIPEDVRQEANATIGVLNLPLKKGS